MKLTVVGCGDAFGSGGRLQTCYLVDDGPKRFLIDCGATALIGLNRLRIDPNSIETIFISHLHGDHFAGLVWWMIHAKHVAKRTSPLTVVGPAGVEARFVAAAEALFPGSTEVQRSFELRFQELGDRAADRYRRRAGDAVRGQPSVRRAILCAALRGRRQGAGLLRRYGMGRQPGRGRPERRPVHHGMLPVRRRAALPHELDEDRRRARSHRRQARDAHAHGDRHAGPARRGPRSRAACWPKTAWFSTYDGVRPSGSDTASPAH